MQRSVKFVKYLPQFGWAPTVVAADDPSYWARDASLLGDIAPDTVVERLSPLRPNAARRLLSWVAPEGTARRIADGVLIPDDRILWALRAALRAYALARGRATGVIYTTSPPPQHPCIGAHPQADDGSALGGRFPGPLDGGLSL